MGLSQHAPLTPFVVTGKHGNAMMYRYADMETGTMADARLMASVKNGAPDTDIGNTGITLVTRIKSVPASQSHARRSHAARDHTAMITSVYPMSAGKISSAARDHTAMITSVRPISAGKISSVHGDMSVLITPAPKSRT